MQYENPLIVQGDRTILLDVHAPLANECRNELIPFAELERSPEHLHTYRLTPLSLWNAASAGFTAEDAVSVLKKYAKYDIPQSVCVWIKEVSDRFGMVRIIPGPKEVVPISGDFFSEEQKKVVYALIGQIIEETENKSSKETETKNSYYGKCGRSAVG